MWAKSYTPQPELSDNLRSCAMSGDACLAAGEPKPPSSLAPPRRGLSMRARLSICALAPLSQPKTLSCALACTATADSYAACHRRGDVGRMQHEVLLYHKNVPARACCLQVPPAPAPLHLAGTVRGIRLLRATKSRGHTTVSPCRDQ